MTNRIVVGDRVRESFWHIIEIGIIKSGSRHDNEKIK